MCWVHTVDLSQVFSQTTTKTLDLLMMWVPHDTNGVILLVSSIQVYKLCKCVKKRFVHKHYQYDFMESIHWVWRTISNHNNQFNIYFQCSTTVCSWFTFQESSLTVFVLVFISLFWGFSKTWNFSFSFIKRYMNSLAMTEIRYFLIYPNR